MCQFVCLWVVWAAARGTMAAEEGKVAGYTRFPVTAPPPDLPTLNDGSLRSGLDYDFPEDFGTLMSVVWRRHGRVLVVLTACGAWVSCVVFFAFVCAVQSRRMCGLRLRRVAGRTW